MALTKIICGVEMNNMMKAHSMFYTQRPIGRDTVELTVLCEHYYKSVHDAVLKHLQVFCKKDENLAIGSVASFLEVQDLNRCEGGFQFVLKTNDDGYITTKDNALNDFIIKYNQIQDIDYSPKLIEKYNTISVEEFESNCQIRYKSNCIEKYGEKFGSSKLVTFIAYNNCPWHIMLELFRLFETQYDSLGCGKTKIVSYKGFPDGNDAVWYTHTIWKEFENNLIEN